MNEVQLHALEPGQHVRHRQNHHELEVLEVEPTNEVYAWDLAVGKAVHVSAWLLEPKVVST